jgi:hypothetical protein
MAGGSMLVRSAQIGEKVPRNTLAYTLPGGEVVSVYRQSESGSKASDASVMMHEAAHVRGYNETDARLLQQSFERLSGRGESPVDADLESYDTRILSNPRVRAKSDNTFREIMKSLNPSEKPPPKRAKFGEFLDSLRPRAARGEK